MRCRMLIGVLAVVFVACSGDSEGTPFDPKTVPDPIPPEVVRWIQTEARPFATAEPGDKLDDLQFLREMIGDARVVALGEATHGTREFFQMKDRILRFLVEEMGFNVFAIEASWPESNRVNTFVHTGEGDPAVLLTGLYFWTWNTQEVLDMILWMRAHNLNPGNSPQVSFLGFDMQYPGMAIHNVSQYLNAVDTAAASEAAARFACVLPFANGPRGYIGVAPYGDKSPEYRDACREDLQAVEDLLLAHRDDYVAASSAEAFALAEQSARVVIQFEDWQSKRTQNARDFAMAENAAWILDHAGPDAKMVVWAHNGHVADDPMYLESASMGYYLKRRYGDGMVTAGFDFYQGEFRAATMLATGQFGSVEVQSVGEPPPYSYEFYYHSAGYPRFVLDVRHRDLSTPATSWLAGPHLMRSVGAGYFPNNPDAYLSEISVPSRYDLIIYFDSTSASTALPYRWPTGW